MKKADRVLLAVITLISAVILCFGILSGLYGKNVRTLSVYADNEIVAEYSLLEDGVYDIKTAYGHNLLTVRDGEAFVSESDCPGGECMRMRISTKGGSIICLPHHLVIKAESGSTEGLDAIAR